MPVNAKGPLMMPHHMLAGQTGNICGLPSKLNSTIGSQNMNHRKLVKNDDDDPPPPISQNHYRHIHEQRDFTMENLSMSGETELEDYYDMKINLENQADLDIDIQNIINNEQGDSNSISSKEQDKGTHYRCNEFVPTRRQAIIAKNKIIIHRNKLVRQARENGKFYLEGGVLSMQQSQMFMFDQQVLKHEHKVLVEKNTNGVQSATYKQTEQTISNMIVKLDQIQTLNNQAKKNDIYKEKLHQTLRDYLSWKNQIFKQNFIQNIPSEVDYSKLFNCNKNQGDNIDGKNDTDQSMDMMTSKN